MDGLAGDLPGVRPGEEEREAGYVLGRDGSFRVGHGDQSLTALTQSERHQLVGMLNDSTSASKILRIPGSDILQTNETARADRCRKPEQALPSVLT